MPGTIDQASELMADALRTLGAVSGDINAAAQLLALLGWDLPPGVADIGLAQLDVSALVTNIEALIALRSQEDASDAQIAAAVAEVVLALKNTLTDLQNFAASLNAEQDYLKATDIVDQFFPRLADLLVIGLVSSSAPWVVPFCVLVGIFEFVQMQADPSIFQVQHIRSIVHWERFGPLFSDPTSLMGIVYDWGTPNFDGPTFITNVGNCAEHFCDHVEFQTLPQQLEEAIVGQPVADAATNPLPQVNFSIVREAGVNAAEVGISLFPLPPTTTGGSDGGLGLSPYVYSATETTFAMSDVVSFEIATQAYLEGIIALVVRPSTKPQLLTDLIFDPPSGPSTAPASFTLTLTNTAPTGQRQTFFSALGITIDAASFSVGFSADASENLNPAFLANITDGRVMIVPDQSDGFLASVLPQGGITASVNLTVEYSQANGLVIQGGAGLSTQFVLNKQLGPIVLNIVQLALNASPQNLTGTAALTTTVIIGPVTATIAAMGASVVMAFQNGNLGPVDLSAGFKPPSGVGLSVDAADVVGGGFLAFDTTQHQYSGVLSLAFNRFALQAFGLITTGDAGGGYTILALIDADFPPMQLGWGFTLDGVGGLLAMHRSASEDALRAAVKSGQVSSILFPKNPITNAPLVLSELHTLFPAAPGRFIFGPMALIGWGTPTVLTASVAVIIELPEPIEIILLARVNALLPDPSAPLVKINMDALGVLDLSQGELSLDASLFDSKLVSFTISGDMALRAVWSGPQREFLLAIGGFHPQFTPPTGFPTLKRIAIDMSSHSIAKLHLDAYLAITSNTIQFGSDLDIFIGVSGFGLAGHLGFDALLQLSPFHFDADISGSLALMGGSDDLTSISVQATLSGPAPWNIAGKFKVHIIFFDVSKSFSVTWGADAPSQQIAAVDVSQLITTSLIDPRNWESQLPYGVSPLVSTRANGDQTSIMAYPSSNLEVHQSVAPLDITIACFGGAPISGATNFAITAFTVGGTALSLVTIQDDFAPAQFFQLTDEEKLARPSYELHDAGVQTDQNLLATGNSIIKPIQYETFYIDSVNAAVRTDPGLPTIPLSIGDLQATILSGASGKSVFRNSGSNRFTAPGNPVAVTPPVFVMVDSTTLTADPASPATGLVYSDVQALMDQAIAANPARRANLEIVATHELVTA
jgi:hypothetical protein